jgi:hypothetical protein
VILVKVALLPPDAPTGAMGSMRLIITVWLVDFTPVAAASRIISELVAKSTVTLCSEEGSA